MKLYARHVKVPVAKKDENLLTHFEKNLQKELKENEAIVRFAVTETTSKHYHCELGIVAWDDKKRVKQIPSIFACSERRFERNQEFNIVLIIPTGIGAELGGHAGDGGPLTKLFGPVCDRLITHPNVVNGSDINELPENGLYVEGSTLSRLMLGTIGLQTVHNNEVLLLKEKHPEEVYDNVTVNSLNAARSSYGLSCSKIIEVNPFSNITTDYTKAGCAAGLVEYFERIVHSIDQEKGKFDAIALASLVKSHSNSYIDYIRSTEDHVNPLGGIEAMLTHTLSLIYNVPIAHSPMMESKEISATDFGVVDPRIAAEMISVSFLQCIFKGLQHSPRLVTDYDVNHAPPGILTAADLSCLIIPAGCLGLPVLAALQQKIPVIAVKNNYNIMKNDLNVLSWSRGCYFEVENYLEAAGIVCALKGGISLDSIKRPILSTPVSKVTGKH